MCHSKPGCGGFKTGQSCAAVTDGHSRLTARAASSAMISSESNDCNIINTLAHFVNTGTSVGEKAVLVLKARNK